MYARVRAQVYSEDALPSLSMRLWFAMHVPFTQMFQFRTENLMEEK